MTKKPRTTDKATDGEPTATMPRKRGRPVENPMPEPIPDTPENIARAIMQGPPKRNWNYLKRNP